MVAAPHGLDHRDVCVLRDTRSSVAHAAGAGGAGEPHESRRGVQNMVGVLIYRTWSAASALAYFSGGALYGKFGPGRVFWLPPPSLSSNCCYWNGFPSRPGASCSCSATESEPVHPVESAATRQRVTPQGFLRLAWVANPFSFVAINTLWAVMPGIGLNSVCPQARVGVFCSVWLFALSGGVRLLLAMDGLALSFPLAVGILQEH